MDDSDTFKFVEKSSLIKIPIDTSSQGSTHIKIPNSDSAQSKVMLNGFTN